MKNWYNFLTRSWFSYIKQFLGGPSDVDFEAIKLENEELKRKVEELEAKIDELTSSVIVISFMSSVNASHKYVDCRMLAESLQQCLQMVLKLEMIQNEIHQVNLMMNY